MNPPTPQSIALDLADDNVTPQAIAESLVTLLVRRQRFTASIFGPLGSGKTSMLAALAMRTVERLHISLNEIAAFAPTYLAIRRLRALIAAHWPELEDPQQDVFAPELSGIPIEALRAHTAMPGDETWLKLNAVVNDYLLVIADANRLDTTHPVDAHFLMGLKARIRSAVLADHEARLDDLPWPKNAYLDAVRQHVSTYKAHRRILDKADLVHGKFYTSPQVKLLLLDEVDKEEHALVARHFPNASVVATSRSVMPADICLKLPRCLRNPDRQDIFDHDPHPGLVPPPAQFDSLFILTAPWRHGPWLAWLRRHGIPPPVNHSRWRAIVAAWKLDRDVGVRAKVINPLLTKCGLQPEHDEPLIYPGDVEGWTDWRDLAGRYDSLMAEHADAVLARYGRLVQLPTVRMGVATHLRHVEADVVIADNFIDSEDEAIATTRATRRLVVMKKPPRPEA